jgi:predicted PurR-regulated permease PerM
MDQSNDGTKATLALELPFRTLLKVVMMVALVAVFTKLAPFLISFFMSLLLAVTMSAAVDWLQGHRVPRTLARTLVALLLVGMIAFTIGVLIPSIIDQLSGLVSRLPALKDDFEKSISSDMVRRYVHPYFENPEKLVGDWTARLAAVLSGVLGAAYGVILITVIAIYLMVEGELAQKWLIAFFNFENQEKVRRTTDEIRPIIFGYVAGQAITSLIVAIYVFAGMQILKVPAALTLATIAAIFDIVPVVGFIASLATALLIGLTVSSGAAIGVVIVYVSYHFLENTLIAPRVYGKSMKLSTLAVLLSILVGGEIAGISGMILALPIVASYPVIEKYWLRRYVGSATIAEHQKQDVKTPDIKK